MMPNSIRPIQLRGVRVNNLKDLSLEIAPGEFIVVCGVSGSGKTSLALDTLYAEGQRRYVESFSPYARRFLEKLDKPDADAIEGMPATIAIRANRGPSRQTTTIGTATETVEFLRLVFARIAQPFCPGCKTAIHKDTPESAGAKLSELPDGHRFMVGFDAKIDSDLKTSLDFYRRLGFVRALVASQTVDLDSAGDVSGTAASIIVDRLAVGGPKGRLRDSLTTAFEFGEGKCSAMIAIEDPMSTSIEIDGRHFRVESFVNNLKCAECGLLLPPADARLFRFTHPQGACEVCEGQGSVESKSGESSPCETCGGKRLNPIALAFELGERNIAEWCEYPVKEMREQLEALELEPWQTALVKTLWRELMQRLQFLDDAGVGYLSLDRSMRSLSSGEASRVRLTSSLSTTLVNILYVLDEPTSGLHPEDVRKVIGTIKGLRGKGNTVVCVDHDRRAIEAASRVLEIGPGAGVDGGSIAFDGLPSELASSGSLTGKYLEGTAGLELPTKRRNSKRFLEIKGCSGNNLKALDVEFPLDCLCVVSGVSGSGKSTLVEQTLFPGIESTVFEKPQNGLPFTELSGGEHFDEVVMIDQSPIGRTPRSNAVTYIKAFDEIRKVFAEQLTAQSRNFTAGHFSFNVAKKGRCEVCEGDGQIAIDMQFLEDVHMKCETCRGTRFRTEILDVKYRGKNIAEVLEMPASEGFGFFRGQPKLQAKLKTLMDVGLGYLPLGQPATTFSTGEGQRLKLALYLNVRSAKRCLFLMDEPCAGLHMADVDKLLETFSALLAVGHSIIAVEHNLQIMEQADWIIDLGPGAASAGGQVIAQGTPEQLIDHEASYTGKHLKTFMARHER